MTGEQAERAQDYDRAVAEYTKILRERPDDVEVRMALDRVKLRGSQEHFARGRQFASTERYLDALGEFQVASELNPTDAQVSAALKDTRDKLRTRLAVTRGGKTELQTLMDRTRDQAPEGLELPSDVKFPDSLVFSNASSRMVFTTIGRFAAVNLVFDPTFREQPISLDLRGSSFKDALASITASTQTFYRVTAPGTITIIPDNAAKRREYEETIVQVFHLSNADIKEVIDLLRIVIDVRSISPMTATNSLALKDTRERVDGSRPADRRDRQGTAGGRDRRGTAGSRSHPAARIRSADCLAGLSGHQRVRGCEPRGTDAGESAQPHGVRRADGRRARRLLPALEERREHARDGQPAAPCIRGRRGAGKVRRACAGAGDDLRADCHRRSQSANNRVVRLREHRRQHRHHAANASRR